ncbi:histone acetyltransferase KAT6A-like [Toxorhynchites rutilus septentrionalis]|uniref:histone acetyltransferase KAT6A-like n=1 Tax=Toxorhynchites rutilus septentrionalis TaxID=329112 RepID=UPI00247AB9AE|nr:histone acetyltransferase KAT6A-like [Toxorhynchites rutilus septentrionalis]
MVQCDACDTWWHFSCAGVADSIADRAWICIRCKPHSRASSRASVASRSSSHLTDSMARLRERQELEKQRAEIGLEKKFLKEQKELLEVSIAAEEERRSRVSRVSRADSIGRVNDWIENSANPQSSATGGNQMPAASEIQQHNLQSTDLNSDATVGDRTILTFDTTEDLSHLLVPTIEDNVDRRETMNLVRDLRARLEQCLAQSEPTVPHMTHLQRQLELCRMAMEAMHSTVHRSSIMPPTGGLTTEGTTGEDGLPRQSAKSLGVPSPSVLPSNPNPNVSLESSEKQLAMQQPTMQPSMTPPSVQSSVMQPSVQQPTLPSLAQQSSTQSLVPPLQLISLQNPQMQCLRVQFPPMPQNSTQHQSSQHLPVMQVPRQPASVQKIPAQQIPVQSTPWQPYQVQRSPVQYPHVQQPPAQYPQVQCHPMMQYSVQDLPMRQSHIQQPPMQQHPLNYLPIQQPPAQYPQTQQSTIQPEAQFAPMQQSTYQSPLQPLQAQTPPTQQFLM